VRLRAYCFLVVITSLLFFNCADKIVTECELDPELSVGEVSATLSDIQQKVFTPSCALSGCHAGVSPVLGLDLSEGKSFTNLVNVTSSQESSLKRVEPGNSLDSYLLRKLTATNTSVMPPGGQLNITLIDSVRAWIDTGAENN
jgi:hypothetical protein